MHPTSIVHGLVRFRDGAAIAHLGYPDMRVPISYALTYPDRAATPIPALDLTAGPLEFYEPDLETFPMLALAREAGEKGGTYPCAFNAANEVAVAAFLDGRIGFLEIAALVADVLERVDGAAARDLDELRRGRSACARAGGAASGPDRGDLRAGGARDDPRGGPLLRGARRRNDAAEVLPRLRPADRARRRAARSSTGSARSRSAGYVKIPGMNRPSPGDLTATLHARGRARRTAPSSRGSTTQSSARTGARPDAELAGAAAGARHDARMWQELEWALAPDAYWRQATWRRLTAIFAGPAVNLAFAFVLFASLFLVASSGARM